jgi:hypothetical protein
MQHADHSPVEICDGAVLVGEGAFFAGLAPGTDLELLRNPILDYVEMFQTVSL